METIVMYPCPGTTHLPPTVELAKLISKCHPSFSIVIFFTALPHETDESYLRRVSAANPSITFITLPAVSLSPNSKKGLLYEVVRLNLPDVRQSLLSICQTSKVKSFVIDFFCYSSSEISGELNIPTYYLFVGAASTLCTFLHLTTIHETITQDLKDADVFINVPGTPPIHALDLPDILYVRNSLIYTHFVNMSATMAKSAGILVNTISALEPRALKALSNGLCVKKGSSSPPVHVVGPLILSGRSEGRDSDKPECLKWLDKQPEKSVVYLCFGSMGRITLEQLRAVAVGLERSGQRFLWVVRSPPAEDGSWPKVEAGVESLVPEGFLERVKGRGFVMNSWAPQVEVLSHPSVGGFVTHCGWNSILEAICNAVPLVALPLYAEQRMNKRYMLEEFKIALPVESSEGGFVMEVTLEKAVRELMESESGKAIRERMTALKEEALAAILEGGSSYVTIAELLDSWKRSD